jgi:hypothetical protein
LRILERRPPPSSAPRGLSSAPSRLTPRGCTEESGRRFAGNAKRAKAHDPSLRNRRELNGWRDISLLVHARCCSLSLGSHSTPSLERFRERVVRIKRQIGVERPRLSSSFCSAAQRPPQSCISRSRIRCRAQPSGLSSNAATRALSCASSASSASGKLPENDRTRLRRRACLRSCRCPQL